MLEEGTVHRPVTGTPQGGVISRILSNIFLHHVLDKWFEEVAKPRLHGQCQLVRFADDFVIALEDRHSGKRMLDVLGKRLGRYGLTLHEAKTCYVDFRRRRPYKKTSPSPRAGFNNWPSTSSKETPMAEKRLGADPILTMEISNLREIVRVYTTLCR